MSDAIISLISNMAGGALGTALVLCFLYIFRSAFSSWLFVKANIDLEKFKGSLSETAEHLKFDLQKDIARTQLYSNSIYTIYPELFQKIRLQHGMVSNFYGFRYANSWEGFNVEDFQKILSERNVPSGTSQKLIAGITANRSDGIKELELFLREVEFSDASRGSTDIMNFVTLKEIFMTEEIRSAVFEIHKMLVSAKVDADMARQDRRNPKWLETMGATMKVVEPKIEALRVMIFKELNPPSRKIT